MAGPIRFVQTAQTTLDANGNGQVSLGPPGADWVVMTTTVATSTSVKQPIANTYLGSSPSQSTLIEGTYSGAGDTSDTKYLLTPGEQVTATWTGGDAGAAATLRLAGLAWPAGEGAANL